MRFSFRLDSSRHYHYGTHPEEVNKLRREGNPVTIKKYPILSFNALVRSYVPKGVPNGEFAKYLKRALGHWKWKQFDTPNKWTKRFRSWWTRGMVRLRMSSWRGFRCFGGSETRKGEREKVSKRVVFTFEAESFSSLEKLQEDGDYPSLAETVKDSLKILWAVQKQAKQGYTELIVRNPNTDTEKLVLDYKAKG